jgi:tripartite-type tricarboxylate transporter receptor subunit TctC
LTIRGSALATAAPVLACALSVVAPGAWGQSYPARTVRIVLGFPAGSTVDVLARPIAQKLSERFGHQFVVDNRPGATGLIANEFVAKAPPDGYVLLVAPGSSITSNPHLHLKMPYDPLKDLIALAKAKPGYLSFGSSGVGSGFHLAGELLKTTAGIDILHVPYKGGNLALSELAAGDIDFMFYSLAVAQPLIKAGKVRAIGVTGQQPDPLLPDVPPLSGSGLPGYDMTGWHGFFAPGATPGDIVRRLNEAIVQILASPQMRELWAANGMAVATNSPEQFAAKVRSEYERYGKLVKTAGIEPR